MPANVDFSELYDSGSGIIDDDDLFFNITNTTMAPNIDEPKPAYVTVGITYGICMMACCCVCMCSSNKIIILVILK